ncbi:MAG: ABC transporter substrate-binding protein [Zoogloeaceae bacterium]|jgi:phospholipid transport system substrate-binding protein|nr:ABC transporter substrate-binding protein [Zoogloeaceae bacterium]
MKKITGFTGLLLTVAAFVAPGLHAQQSSAEIAPNSLVQSVTEDVLKILRQDKEIQNGNTKKTIALVHEKVLPHFNFKHMTQLAVGRDWKNADTRQQNELALQFRDLLVRTYANAVSSYRDQKVVYKPFKMSPEETDVLVRTEIVQPGGRPIQLDYSMEKTKQGWKVYDVIVGGVSLVTNYRDNFAQEIRAGGIDGLIKSLAEKNKALAAQGKA